MTSEEKRALDQRLMEHCLNLSEDKHRKRSGYLEIWKDNPDPTKPDAWGNEWQGEWVRFAPSERIADAMEAFYALKDRIPPSETFRFNLEYDSDYESGEEYICEIAIPLLRVAIAEAGESPAEAISRACLAAIEGLDAPQQEAEKEGGA